MNVRHLLRARCVTVAYNLARLCESLGDHALAEDLYHSIVSKHPYYVDGAQQPPQPPLLPLPVRVYARAHIPGAGSAALPSRPQSSQLRSAAAAGLYAA